MGDARAFISAARKVAIHKPILVIKAGRTTQAAQAAASHTGSMTGSDDVLDEAFKRAGVLRVDSIGELFSMAQVLAKQPLPHGNRLTLLTNAGGPAVLATDALIRSKGELGSLSEQAIKDLSLFLPASWSHANPVDILGDADASRYEKAFKRVLEEEQSDAVLVILTPQDMTEPTKTAAAIIEAQKDQKSLKKHKPVLASWMGGVTIEEGFHLLKDSGIATFESPDEAAKAFCYMCQWQRQREALLETPEEVVSDLGHERCLKAKVILDQVRVKGRLLLTEGESKDLLSLYDIPTTPIKIARSVEEALQYANEMGYPVVLKLLSETLTHKTDVGGVKLNLIHAQAVKTAFLEIQKSVSEIAGSEHFLGVSVQPMIRLKDAYEVIVGSSIDPQVGPVLMFGSGGQLVEVYKDYALALAPLNSVLIQQWIEKTKIYQALCGVRGRAPVNFDELKALLMRFSQMVTDLDSIAEIEINPLVINSERMIALDARVALRKEGVACVQPAIRPYPQAYIFNEKLPLLGSLIVRPIRPEDEPAISVFHKSLSEQTIRGRFFRGIELDERSAHERLARICYCDYSLEMALVVETQVTRNIVGVGRLRRLSDPLKATFSLIIGDPWQKKGLGHLILEKLIEVARSEKFTSIHAVMQKNNYAMKKLCERFGFNVLSSEGEYVKVSKEL
jgi:acetyltransferase